MRWVSWRYTCAIFHRLCEMFHTDCWPGTNHPNTCLAKRSDGSDGGVCRSAVGCAWGDQPWSRRGSKEIQDCLDRPVVGSAFEDTELEVRPGQGRPRDIGAPDVGGNHGVGRLTPNSASLTRRLRSAMLPDVPAGLSLRLQRRPHGPRSRSRDTKTGTDTKLLRLLHSLVDSVASWAVGIVALLPVARAAALLGAHTASNTYSTTGGISLCLWILA